MTEKLYPLMIELELTMPGGASTKKADISAYVLDTSNIKKSLFDESFGVASSSAPSATLNIVKNEITEQFFKDIQDPYNLICKIYLVENNTSKPYVIFIGVLVKKAEEFEDVIGIVYTASFIDEIFTYPALTKLADPWLYSEYNVGIGNGNLGKRQLFSFETIEKKWHTINNAIKLLYNTYGKSIDISYGFVQNHPLKGLSPSKFHSNPYSGPELYKNMPDIYEGIKDVFPLDDSYYPSPFDNLSLLSEGISKITAITDYVENGYFVVGSNILYPYNVLGFGYDYLKSMPVVDLFGTGGSSEIAHPAKRLKLDYNGDVKYACKYGYRIIALEYKLATDKYYAVIEANEDNLEQGITRLPGDDYEQKCNQFELSNYNGAKSGNQNLYDGEIGAYIYTVEFNRTDLDEEKTIYFNANNRLKKYHKGIKVYSKRVDYFTGEDLDTFNLTDKILHHTEEIGTGHPSTDRDLGIPFPFIYLLAKLAKPIKGTWCFGGNADNTVTLYPVGADWNNTFVKNPNFIPDGEGDAFTLGDYLIKGNINGSHVYIHQRPANKNDKVGFTEYLGRITDIHTNGIYKTITFSNKAVFNYLISLPINGSTRIIIVPDKYHPVENILFQGNTDVETANVSLVDESLVLDGWRTTTDIEIEKKREKFSRLNYFYKSIYDTISESKSSKFTPGLYSFISSPTITQFVGEESNDPVSALPRPFYVKYNNISSLHQFLPADKFYVVNNRCKGVINESEEWSINPEVGRKDAFSSYYPNIIVRYEAGTTHACLCTDNSGGSYKVLYSYGNIYLKKETNGDIYAYVNDFEEYNDNDFGIIQSDWFANCKIYKWNSSLYGGKGAFERKFTDRVSEQSKDNFYNLIYNYNIGDTDVETLLYPSRYFTDCGMMSDTPPYNTHCFTPLSEEYTNIDFTGVKVVGACNPSYANNVTGMETSIVGYSGGAQATLILQGDATEKFSEGDLIRLYWKKRGQIEYERENHVPDFRIVGVETRVCGLGSGNNIVRIGYRYTGLWTLLKIESVPLKADFNPSNYTWLDPYDKDAIDLCVQASIVYYCCDKKTKIQLGHYLVDDQSPAHPKDFYYIFKVGKPQTRSFVLREEPWSHFDWRINQIFPTWYLIHKYSGLGYIGKEYLQREADYIPGEELTPTVTDIYNKLPYVTLGKKNFHYRYYNNNDPYKTLDNNGFIEIYNIETKSRIYGNLVFYDSEIEEPRTGYAYVKPNCGDDLDECRVIFSRDMNNKKVKIDYKYYGSGYYSNLQLINKKFETNGGIYTALYPMVIAQNDPDKAGIFLSDNVIHWDSFMEFPNEKVIGSDNLVFSSDVGGLYRLVLLANNIICMVSNNPWKQLPEINFKNLNLVDFLTTYATSVNAFVKYDYPYGVYFIDKETGEYNTLPTNRWRSIKKLSQETYKSVVCNYKNGKYIYSPKDYDYTTREYNYDNQTIEEPAYEFNCSFVETHSHAGRLAKTVYDFYKNKNCYELVYDSIFVSEGIFNAYFNLGAKIMINKNLRGTIYSIEYVIKDLVHTTIIKIWGD